MKKICTILCKTYAFHRIRKRTKQNQAHEAFTTHNQHETKVFFFKIVNQFTQYRLLVNHNKYTFQYIIHNKYWKSKLNTGSLKLDAVSLYLSLLTLYALAQLICTVGHGDATDCLKAVCTLPLYCRSGVRVPSYSAVTHIRLQCWPLWRLNMGRYLQAWERDKYLNSCRSRELKVKNSASYYSYAIHSIVAVSIAVILMSFCCEKVV